MTAPKRWQLIGIYLLNLLTTEINLECNLGLYRDNGLIVCEGSQLESCKLPRCNIQPN